MINLLKSLFAFSQKWLFQDKVDASLVATVYTDESSSSGLPSQNLNSNSNLFKIVDDDKLELQDTLDEIKFNSSTRDLILISCIFMLLHVYSYNKLSLYIKLQERSSKVLDEKIIQFTTANVCSFSLTNIILFVFILPISMISNELLVRHKESSISSSYYLQWLSEDLLATLYSGIRICSNLTLFMFLPFCYFLIESEGKTSAVYTRSGSIVGSIGSGQHEKFIKDADIYTGTHSQASYQSSSSVNSTNQKTIVFSKTGNLKSRLLESLLIFSLVIGILAVITALLSKFKTVNLHSCFYEGYTLISLIILLLTAPRGFSKMFHMFGNELLERPSYLSKKAALELVNLEVKISAAKRAGHKKLVGKYEKEYGKLIKSKNTKLWKKVLYPIALILLLTLPVLTIIFSVYHIMEILFFKKLLPKIEHNYLVVSILDSIEVISSNYNKYGKKLTIIKTFGVIGTLVEAVIILYLFASSVCGFYTLPKLSRLKPKKFNTSLQKMIVNCMLLLSISSSLPLLSITLNFVDAKDVLNQNSNLLLEYDLENNENIHLVLILNIFYIASTILSLLSYLNMAIWDKVLNKFREGDE